MNTHKSIYGYLSSTLHFADTRKSFVETAFYSDSLGCLENNPEEILYKAHWAAYFKGKL
jgi:hypothetical protein